MLQHLGQMADMGMHGIKRTCQVVCCEPRAINDVPQWYLPGPRLVAGGGPHLRTSRLQGGAQARAHKPCGADHREAQSLEVLQGLQTLRSQRRLP